MVSASPRVLGHNPFWGRGCEPHLCREGGEFAQSLPACLPPSQETPQEEPACDPLASAGERVYLGDHGEEKPGPTSRTPTEPNEAVPRSSLWGRAGQRGCGCITFLPPALSSASRGCPPEGRTGSPLPSLCNQASGPGDGSGPACPPLWSTARCRGALPASNKTNRCLRGRAVPEEPPQAPLRLAAGLTWTAAGRQALCKLPKTQVDAETTGSAEPVCPMLFPTHLLTQGASSLWGRPELPAPPL